MKIEFSIPRVVPFRNRFLVIILSFFIRREKRARLIMVSMSANPYSEGYFLLQ
ncbi:hypothetical protein HMPREF1981_00832 [Bacteroides pyogenes F0041]|uniref:Uncharacterized protein n=1 Tax=Bacteroides pyogenes F0041 TaxID=1321819 RepID=U2E2R7_9BACE|nr:hypothetical protein HMPREF1981_00832 [Bacteroides pyogenes F0041]GAE20711.1 hypothetical protein JCM10003_61 [Bacteroides pyogenes JCM 10003]